MLHYPIGILGGTFDPIHLGHLHLATTIKEKCNLEKVILIPCYQSPLRQLPLASSADRLQMIKLAIEGYDFIKVDDREITNKNVSYSIDTLQSLSKNLTNKPLCLLMGIDAFNKFDSWHEWQKILELTHIIVVNRPNFSTQYSSGLKEIIKTRKISDPAQLTTKTAGYILFIDIQPLAISASEIREKIKAGKDCSRFLPQKVWEYIRRRGLYLK